MKAVGAGDYSSRGGVLARIEPIGDSARGLPRAHAVRAVFALHRRYSTTLPLAAPAWSEGDERCSRGQSVRACQVAAGSLAVHWGPVRSLGPEKVTQSVIGSGLGAPLRNRLKLSRVGRWSGRNRLMGCRSQNSAAKSGAWHSAFACEGLDQDAARKSRDTCYDRPPNPCRRRAGLLSIPAVSRTDISDARAGERSVEAGTRAYRGTCGRSYGSRSGCPRPKPVDSES